jgi:hypothetical protein
MAIAYTVEEQKHRGMPIQQWLQAATLNDSDEKADGFFQTGCRQNCEDLRGSCREVALTSFSARFG